MNEGHLYQDTEEFYCKTLPKRKFESLFEDIRIKKPKQKIQQSDLITVNEYRAIISTLYYSGCMIGEMLLMKIRRVRVDNYGALLVAPFEGKTGTRQVRITGDLSRT